MFSLSLAVLAIVLAAVWYNRVCVLKRGPLSAVAAAAFAALYFCNIPFPLLILATGLLGLAVDRLVLERLRAALAANRAAQHRADGTVGTTLAAAVRDQTALYPVERPLWPIGSSVLLFAMLWFPPLVLLGASLGWSLVFVWQGGFFGKAAVVSFGRAYAMLTYIAQQAVER